MPVWLVVLAAVGGVVAGIQTMKGSRPGSLPSIQPLPNRPGSLPGRPEDRRRDRCDAAANWMCLTAARDRRIRSRQQDRAGLAHSSSFAIYPQPTTGSTNHPADRSHLGHLQDARDGGLHAPHVAGLSHEPGTVFLNDSMRNVLPQSPQDPSAAHGPPHRHMGRPAGYEFERLIGDSESEPLVIGNVGPVRRLQVDGYAFAVGSG